MEDAHVAVLDLRAHPGCPGDADTLARAFFGVSTSSPSSSHISRLHGSLQAVRPLAVMGSRKHRGCAEVAQVEVLRDGMQDDTWHDCSCAGI